jgi:type IV secretion system protein VirD4
MRLKAQHAVHGVYSPKPHRVPQGYPTGIGDIWIGFINPHPGYHPMQNLLKSAALLAATTLFILLYFGVDAESWAQSNGLFGHSSYNRNQYQPPNLAWMRAVIIILSGGAGFALGWFMSPQARHLRIFVIAIVGGAIALAAIGNNGVLGWSLTPLVAIGAFGVGFGYWMAAFVRKLAEIRTTFGSASWATKSEMAKNGLFNDAGYRVGDVIAGDLMRKLSYVSDRHLLTIAPNRSGKGASAIIPNLLTYEGSVLVIDPKGENALITAERRKAMGQTVHVVDPWGITGMKQSRFNPLDGLKLGDVDISENAKLLADAIIVPSYKGEPFWIDAPKALLDGVSQFVATDKSEKGQRNLGRVRDLLLLDGDDLNALFKRMLASPHKIVRSAAARSLQKDPKLLSNVMASLQAQTHFLDSPRLREAMCESDFKFEDLKSEKVSIYLVLPADRLNAFASWLRVLVQQAISVNARNIEEKPDKSVLFILDEMPALGKLAMVEQAFGLMAGYGFQCWGICQDASQLKRIYGDGWETFISNAGMIQYFGSRDNFSAEYFSKLCGVTTVWNASTAIARAVGITRSKDSSRSETTTETDTATGTQRKLAFPDELMRLPADKQLILIENMNPIIATKTPWFIDPKLKSLGVNLHKNAARQKFEV